MANRAAHFRFMESKKTEENDEAFVHIQFALPPDDDIDGVVLPCLTECEPDPYDTSVTPPDEISKKDKCRVQVGEIQEMRSCVPIARVDTLRKMIGDARKDFTKEMKGFIAEISNLNEHYSKISQKHNNLKVERDEYVSKVAELFSQKTQLLGIMDILNSNATQLEEWKKALRELKGKLDELKLTYEKPEGDCSGLPQYEKDLEGDGLMGSYYSNIYFMGEAKRRVDKRVKFFWANENPIEGVSPNKYSVEWVGFIRPPKQDTYTFYCESDDGCIVSLNNSEILRDNIPVGENKDLLHFKKQEFNTKIAEGGWDDFIKPPGMNDPDRFPRNYTSKDMPLDAGTFVPIKIQVLHSVHNSLHEDGNSWVYLYWESSKIRKQIIPSQYLYTKIKSAALKPTNYDSQNLYLDTLEENDNAFMDKITWKVKYIPANLQGLQVLKPKMEYNMASVTFSVEVPIRVYVAYQADMITPLESTFNLTEYEMALLKISTSDQAELLKCAKEPTKCREVVAQEDVALEIRYKDFSDPGQIEIKTSLQKPAKMLFIIAPGPKSPLMTCGGDEYEISSSASPFYKSCDETSKDGEDGCDKAFNMDKNYWTASNKNNESVTLHFNSFVKPTAIWVGQPQDSSNMAAKVNVWISKKDYFTLDASTGLVAMYEDDLEKNWQKFAFVKTKELDELRIEVLGIKGGNNIQNKFRVMGVACNDPTQIEKQQQEEVRKELNLKKKMPKIESYLCDQDLSTMSSDEKAIYCIQPCKLDLAKNPADFFEPLPGKFKLDSKPCVAAMKAFGAENAGRRFGIKRIPNYYDLPDDTRPPYLFVFDQTLVEEPLIFGPNEEVDVLDPNECFIRGVIENIDSSSIKFKYNGESRTTMKENVYKCGSKNPFVPCATAETKPIKIKFAPAKEVPTLVQKNIGSFLYDTGDIAKKHGVFTYGWTRNAKTQTIDKLGDFSAKDKLIWGTGAVMLAEGDQWFINLPNGNYDVKIALKVIENAESLQKFPPPDSKAHMVFSLNEQGIDEELAASDQIIVDKPLVKVTDNQIKLSYKPIEGNWVSIVYIEIIAHNPMVEEGGPTIEMESKSYRGPKCYSSPMDCLFYDNELKKAAECPGVYVKIKGHAKNKSMACMNKCVKNYYEEQNECLESCPETLKCLNKNNDGKYYCEYPTE